MGYVVKQKYLTKNALHGLLFSFLHLKINTISV